MPQRPSPEAVRKARSSSGIVKRAQQRAVQRIRRSQCFRHSYAGTTVLRVTSAVPTWAAYIRQVTERPGWSVARLAREAQVSTARIWDWINGKSARGAIMVVNVLKVAAAVGDDPMSALRAAAELLPEQAPEDDVMLILRSDWPDDVKARMIERLNAARRADEPEQRREAAS